MKLTRLFSVLIVFIVLISSCKVQYKYIPVETTKTEYRDITKTDSIYVLDSIRIKEKGDTVLIEKWRVEYREKQIRDSIFIKDSIAVPYPIEVPYAVEKKLSWFQNMQIWLGRVLLALIVFCILYTIFKNKSFILKIIKKIL